MNDSPIFFCIFHLMFPVSLVSPFLSRSCSFLWAKILVLSRLCSNSLHARKKNMDGQNIFHVSAFQLCLLNSEPLSEVIDLKFLLPIFLNSFCNALLTFSTFSLNKNRIWAYLLFYRLK